MPSGQPAPPTTGGPPTSATANAVLGLLSFGRELSGYDLKKWADHSLQLFFWSPAMSQIYTELQRLESLGLVTSRLEEKADARPRRLYAITDDGRTWLSHWLASEPVDLPVLKNAMVLRVWLGDLMDPDTLTAMVREHRDRLQARLERTREDRRTITGWASMAHAEVVIRWAERYYAAEVENSDLLLEDLAALETPG